MKTQLVTDPIQAARIISRGGVVAFPTETVFGLGADATNPIAISKLFIAKGRPSDNPLIVHVPDINHLDRVSRHVPFSARQFLDAFAPGPITVVVPKRPVIIDAVTAGFDSVGVRIPQHPLAVEFLRYAGVPLAAPSANRSGKPSGTSVEAVVEDLDGYIDAILCGQVSQIGMESTVVDCTVDPPRLLRSGAITLEQLRSVDATIQLPNPTNFAVNSPGMRYAHYQPRARVQLFDAVEEVQAEIACACLCVAMHPNSSQMGFYRQFDSIEQYARDFYESLRQADRLKMKRVYCQRVAEEGLGRALTDRMRRAAGE